MTELQKTYKEKVAPELKKKFDIKNTMSVPTIKKIVVNMGIGKEYTTNTGVVDDAKAMLAEITGQSPVVINSKEAISNFKLRKGMPNGIKVTLRKDRMWDFYYKLVNIALPRVKDFRGVPAKSFDKSGSTYTLGIREHIIFPEIDTSVLSKIRSLQVVVVTSGKNKEETMELLKLLGMPFQKQRNQHTN